MSKPLEGIRIVEVAMWAFVPAAGAILSDMGAEIIKVEPPTGDPMRGLQTQLGDQGRPAIDFSWESYNRGKRSITLDLKRDAGVAVLYRLLENADVFLTNLLPPARWGRMGRMRTRAAMTESLSGRGAAFPPRSLRMTRSGLLGRPARPSATR